MNLKQKFERIIELVEKNVEKDAKHIAPVIGKDLGVDGRVVSESFSFMTSTSFGDYVRRRRLSRIMVDILRIGQNERGNDVIGHVAYKYGYSERSTFDRAFKKEFSVTPSAVKKGAPFKGVEMLLFDDILDNDTEIEMNHTRIDEKITAAVIDDLVSSGSMIINLDSEDDRVLLNVIMDCQSLYGLSTEQVLLAYELSDDKTRDGIVRASEAISIAYKEFEQEEKGEDFKDVIYLVINNNLYFEEAEKIVSDIRNGSNVDVRRIEKGYLDMIARYNYMDGTILKNLPYDVYLSKKQDVLHMLNRATGIEIKPQADGTIRGQLFYDVFSYLAEYFTKEEIANPTDEQIKIMDLMLASVKGCSNFSRDKATVVSVDLEQEGINDWRNCDEHYKKILFAPASKRLIKYGFYLNLIEELQDYGVSDPEDVQEIVKWVNKTGKYYSYKDKISDILHKRNLADKYGIRGLDSLEELVNDRVSIDDVCAEFVKAIGKTAVMPRKLFSDSMDHLGEAGQERQKKLLCTNGEKLALMMSINCKISYPKAKEAIEIEFNEEGIDFTTADNLYFEINRMLAIISKEDVFDWMPFSEYKAICEMVPENIERREDVIFFSAITWRVGIYSSAEESVKKICIVFSKTKFLNSEYELPREEICFMYMNNESLRTIKPDEIDESILELMVLP